MLADTTSPQKDRPYRRSVVALSPQGWKSFLSHLDNQAIVVPLRSTFKIHQEKKCVSAIQASTLTELDVSATTPNRTEIVLTSGGITNNHTNCVDRPSRPQAGFIIRRP